MRCRWSDASGAWKRLEPICGGDAREVDSDRYRFRVLQAEAQAKLEAATTRQVGDFMVSLFEGADPNIAGRQDLSAASLVDEGRERIDADLKGQPGLQAAMNPCWAKVYENIGRPHTAIELYEQAARSLLQRWRCCWLARCTTWGCCTCAPTAETSYRESLAIRQALLPAGDMSVARSQHNLGRWLVRAARGRPMAPRSTMSVIAPSSPRCTAWCSSTPRP